MLHICPTTPTLFHIMTSCLHASFSTPCIDENMEEFQDTLTRCARLEVRKKAALMREARLVAKHEYERKQLQLAQDSIYKVCMFCEVKCSVV